MDLHVWRRSAQHCAPIGTLACGMCSSRRCLAAEVAYVLELSGADKLLLRRPGHRDEARFASHLAATTRRSAFRAAPRPRRASPRVSGLSALRAQWHQQLADDATHAWLLARAALRIRMGIAAVVATNVAVNAFNALQGGLTGTPWSLGYSRLMEVCRSYRCAREAFACHQRSAAICVSSFLALLHGAADAYAVLAGSAASAGSTIPAPLAHKSSVLAVLQGLVVGRTSALPVFSTKESACVCV